jgi:tetratricopeptide (TPR) repeat protein
VASRRKLTRKDLVRQDEFGSRLEQAAVYVVDHPQPFLLGIAGVVVVAVAAMGWTLYAGSRNESAQAALGSVIRAYHDLSAFESDEARYQAALAEANRVGETYGGLPAGRIARYYAALSHEGLGEIDEAVRLLGELAASSDAVIRPVARYALGQTYKRQQDFDRAIGVYQDLLESGEHSAPALVFEIAQLHEAAGRPAEARSSYESLLANYPESVYQPEAERALKRLGTADSGDA